MYQNEEDIYGDELDGDEDRNDGLNALVYTVSIINNYFRICNGYLDLTKTLIREFTILPLIQEL